MTYWLRWGFVLIVLQVALFGLYWVLDSRRAVLHPTGTALLGLTAPHVIDVDFPSLSVRRRDGSRELLSPPTRPTLLHFWATWCPPCRHELPGLLELSESSDVNVLLISLDANWEIIDQMLAGQKLGNVLLGDASEIEQALQVLSLPTTFFLLEGRLILRFDGPRDWENPGFLRSWWPAGVPTRKP